MAQLPHLASLSLARCRSDQVLQQEPALSQLAAIIYCIHVPRRSTARCTAQFTFCKQ